MLAQLERGYTFTALDYYRKFAFRLNDFQLTSDRYIIFSDAHIGDRRSPHDEFQGNETLYCNALRYYLDQDYGLILNGDVEEGWKNRYRDIVSAYENSVYALEREFAAQGEKRHLRIWGNHDDDWKDQALVDRHLGGILKRKVRVHPAVMLNDRIIITHGHQGDPNADKFAAFSRWVVRRLWQPIQSVFKIERTTPGGYNVAWKRRERHLYDWAQARKMLLIAGHTHRPMFHEFTPSDPQINRLRDNLTAQLGLTHDPQQQDLLQSALDYLEKTAPVDEAALPKMTPCYLNAGSCLSHDGITGIEIDRGEIRLVKWTSATESSAARTVYQQGYLPQMLANI